jgi:hypothetical protein
MKNKDYYEIPWVKEYIDRVKKMQTGEDENLKKSANMFLFQPGKEFILRVSVTDPYLFQFVVASILEEDGTLDIPGARLLAIDYDIDKLTPEKKIKQWLEKQLKDFEDEQGGE